MGWRDSVNQNLAQSNSMSIEFANNLDPKAQRVVPGTVLSGHVVVRPIKPLNVGSLRITLYGISDAHILRKISTIQNHFYGRGFLFHEILTLASGPLSLDPVAEGSPGYRYLFSFTMPEMTSSMKENTANVINKWKPAPPFAGAEEMHPLPPTLESRGKSLLGYHESSVSYRLDATCEKTKGGTSTIWLPQVATDLRFFPIRAEQNPNPRCVALKCQPQSLKAGGQCTFLLQVPSVTYPGGPFPILVGCDGVAGANLTNLEVKLKGEVETRARNLLFGEKVVAERREIDLANWKNLGVPLVQELGTLNAIVPQGITPTFRSFTVALSEYRVIIKYTIQLGAEVVRGEVKEGSVQIMSPLSS